MTLRCTKFIYPFKIVAESYIDFLQVHGLRYQRLLSIKMNNIFNKGIFSLISVISSYFWAFFEKILFFWHRILFLVNFNRTFCAGLQRG